MNILIWNCILTLYNLLERGGPPNPKLFRFNINCRKSHRKEHRSHHNFASTISLVCDLSNDNYPVIGLHPLEIDYMYIRHMSYRSTISNELCCISPTSQLSNNFSHLNDLPLHPKVHSSSRAWIKTVHQLFKSNIIWTYFFFQYLTLQYILHHCQLSRYDNVLIIFNVKKM